MGKGIIVYSNALELKTAKELTSFLGNIKELDEIVKFETYTEEEGHRAISNEVLQVIINGGLTALTTLVGILINNWITARGQDKSQKIEIKKADGSYISVPEGYLTKEDIRKWFSEEKITDVEDIDHIALKEEENKEK